MKRNKALYFLSCAGLALQAFPALAACQSGSAAASVNAGCMVIVDQRLLVVRDRKSGRLGFPGGSSQLSEDARCTAERETLEETGLQVRADELLARLGNGFHLYRCHPRIEQALPIKPPVSAWLEIETLGWIDPRKAEASEWRFPEQLPGVQRLFEQMIEQAGP